jgi:hypothetical protein
MSRLKRLFEKGTISLGPRCNNRCIFCFYAAERGRPDRTMMEVLAEIERAREFVSGDILTFSGGEPTVRSDIVELCAYARRTGFKGVNLQTNGRALADRDLARALARNGMNSCFVSLHADTPSLYEQLTGAKDGFAEVLEGLGNLEELGVLFTINVVITRDNYRRLPRIYAFLRSAFASFKGLRLSYPRITGAAAANFGKVVPRFGEIGPYVRRTLDLARQDGVEALCDLIPTCVLGPHADRDIAPHRKPFYISDPAPGGPLGLDYSMKYSFCSRCAAVDFCCGVPLEYARRLPYREELKTLSRISSAPPGLR